LLVLAHHRIGDPRACPYSEDLFTATPAGLAEQVSLLSRWTRLTSLDEVLSNLSGGRRPSEALVLLTFDDVYRDNYTHAFPILRDAGAPAVFFVPTGLIETQHVPWWDRIAYAIKHSTVDSCRLSYPNNVTIDGIHRNPDRAALQALRLYKAGCDLDKERFIAALEDATGAAAHRAVAQEELFASWRELREMTAGGMTLASHTHTHRLLGHLPFAQQREELARSRELLRERAGVETQAIAYPVGQRTHFNDDTRRALRETDYRLGFSHYGGWNPRIDDPFDIRRVRMELRVDTELLHAAVGCPPLFAA
jgi:peptidoglycan/xylan/chitin deacetylase (PgdA/CDA1 family)